MVKRKSKSKLSKKKSQLRYSKSRRYSKSKKRISKKKIQRGGNYQEISFSDYLNQEVEKTQKLLKEADDEFVGGSTEPIYYGGHYLKSLRNSMLL